MTLPPNIETFIGCDAAFEDASIVLYGAPFDSTTSYRPGTRQGPAAIRHESYGLETYSPYQDRDLATDARVFVEQFGARYVTVFNSARATVKVRLTAKVGARASEHVEGGEVSFADGVATLELAPDAVRVLDFNLNTPVPR